MKISTVKMPSSMAIKYLSSELSSYAYMKDEEILMVLSEFFYDENQKIKSKILSYPLPKSNELTKHFTLTNEIIPGTALISIPDISEELSEDEWIVQANDLLLKLYNFTDSTTCMSFNSPVFNSDNTDMGENVNTDKVIDPYKNVRSDDIIMDIPDKPIDFGYVPELDKEIL